MRDDAASVFWQRTLIRPADPPEPRRADLNTPASLFVRRFDGVLVRCLGSPCGFDALGE